MKAKFYLGRKGTARIVFKSETIPTQETHGHLYTSVMGPFRTKRGAMFQAAFGDGNPHTYSVSATEKIAAKYSS